jgi:hypothetical protein
MLIQIDLAMFDLVFNLFTYKLCSNISQDLAHHKEHSSLNLIRKIKARRMRRARNLALMGAKGNAYKALVRKPEGKRLPGRP